MSFSSKGADLSIPSAIHNVILTLWSLAMFVRITLDIVAVSESEGADALFCTTKTTRITNTMSYALYMYYLSKFYELIDTVILAMKKHDIIFLHWYHHSIVIVMAWSWVHYNLAFAAYAH